MNGLKKPTMIQKANQRTQAKKTKTNKIMTITIKTQKGTNPQLNLRIKMKIKKTMSTSKALVEISTSSMLTTCSTKKTTQPSYRTLITDESLRILQPII